MCRYASLYEKLFLRGVVAEFRRLGVQEATFAQVCPQVKAVFASEGNYVNLGH